MGKQFALWTCILSCGACDSLTETEVPRSPRATAEFQVHASVLEAIEGGPLVIKTTLKYCGERPRQIHCTPNSKPEPSFERPNMPIIPAQYLSVRGDGGIHSITRKDIQPGEEWSQINYVHHYYGFEDLPSGRVKLTISWPTLSYTPHMIGPVCPETVLEVNIQPADAKHLSPLRHRLEHQYSIATNTHDAAKIRDIVDQISYTKHAALVPLARRIIEHHRIHIFYEQLLCLVAQRSEDLHEADLWLARLLSELDLSERRGLVRCWAQRETPISPDAFYLLTNSASFWDRLLAYIYLGKLCDQRWVNKLLTDLPKLTQPPPPPEFGHLLRDLDNNSFRVREKTSAELEQFGERVESQLQQALRTDLSPEAKRRVHFILVFCQS